MSDQPQFSSNERMQILARFLRSQIALADRPPVGRVELNNEEAEVCAKALDMCSNKPTGTQLSHEDSIHIGRLRSPKYTGDPMQLRVWAAAKIEELSRAALEPSVNQDCSTLDAGIPHAGCICRTCDQARWRIVATQPSPAGLWGDGTREMLIELRDWLRSKMPCNAGDCCNELRGWIEKVDQRITHHSPTATQPPRSGCRDELADSADMEEIGRAFMDSLHRNLPDYSWCDSPSEVIVDLVDQRDDARASQPPADDARDAARWRYLCSLTSEQWSALAEVADDEIDATVDRLMIERQLDDDADSAQRAIDRAHES